MFLPIRYRRILNGFPVLCLSATFLRPWINFEVTAFTKRTTHLQLGFPTRKVVLFFLLDFGLVVISSSENEDHAHIASALEQYRVTAPLKLPTPDDIRKYLKKKFKSVGDQQGKVFFDKETKSKWVPAAEVDQDRYCWYFF